MKTMMKRIFPMLLALTLVISCISGVQLRSWADEGKIEWSKVRVNPSQTDDDPVEAVMELLAQIDSLEQMQAYRVTVTKEVFQTPEGGYSSGNYANRTEQHIEAQNRYQQYLKDMFAKRAAAKEAYEALTDEQKAQIAADETAAANLAKLTPYNKLPTAWLTQDRLIIAQTEQTAEQLQFPIPITPTQDESDPYIYEFVRAYELSLSHCESGYLNSFALVDTTGSEESWLPSGLYEYGKSNYQLAYCCDCINNAHRGYHYRRINLEDADYYNRADAAHIRTIVENSYPFRSIVEMKRYLVSNGFDPEMTTALTRSDIIAAVQMAIWSYSNAPDKADYVYKGTSAPIEARDRRDYLLLPSLHDYRNEDWTWYLIAPGDYYSSSGYRYTYYEELAQRINALTEFLCSLPGTEPRDEQIVISSIEIARTALIPGEDDTYEIDLNVFLNHGIATDNDDVRIQVSAAAPDGSSADTSKEIAVDDRTVYHVRAKAKDGETIHVVVEGTQELEKGVYYYEVEGGTKVSQSLVGVAAGTTRVRAEKSFTFNREDETGIRVFKTAKGSKLPISDITFNAYRVELAEGETIGQAPTQEEVERFAVEENLAGTMTTDETGYGFLALPRGTYLVMEELNADKVQEAADPFYVTLPNPVEQTGEDGAVTVVYEDTADFHIENLPAGAVLTNLEVTKAFNGWDQADSFTFQLAAVSTGAPIPEETTAVATEENPAAKFGTMIFDREGIFRYTITEIDDGVDGVSYDTAAHSVVVTVTKGEGNALSAEVTYDGEESLTITNTFTPATAAVEVTKEFNDWGKANSFTFRLAAVTEDAPMPESNLAAATEEQPIASFGELTFDKAGIYAYTLTEIDEGLDGVSYDTEAHSVVVTVTKGEGNALSAEVTYDGEESLTITNTFTPTTAVVEVTKAFNDWGKANSFTFQLAAVTEGAPMPESNLAVATEKQPLVSFGEITFEKAGIFAYTMTEVDDGLDGVRYDTAAHSVVVTVTKGEGNALSAAVTYDGKESLTITNTFTPAVAAVEVTKEFNGWGKADSFTFQLAAVTAGAPMPESNLAVASEKQPLVSFGEITFEKAGVYAYTLTEVDDGVDGVSYDIAAHSVVVTVTKGEGNVLSAAVTYDGKESLTITNTFTPAAAVVEVTKEFNDWSKADRFAFELVPVTDGAPMPESNLAFATEKQPLASFGELTFDKAGTYEYTLTEVDEGVDGVTYDTRAHRVLVTVTKGEGNALSAEVTYDGEESLTITNTFAPAVAVVEVTKEFNDWSKAEHFAFELSAVTAGAPMPESSLAVATEKQPLASFGELTFDRAGVYEYILTEVDDGVDGVAYDTAVHSIAVIVTKERGNVLSAAVTYDGEESLTITNTFTPAAAVMEVTKEFNDWGRATSFTFRLAAITVGAPMPNSSTVVVTQQQPKAAFAELTYDRAGIYEYTLTEVDDGVAGVTYDTTAHRVVVTVTKGEGNALSAAVTYDGAEHLIITNTFAPAAAVIEVTKQFNDWSRANSFTFKLAAVTAGAPMPKTAYAVATEKQPLASFGAMTFDKVGIYEYALSEVDEGADGVTYDKRSHRVLVIVSKGQGNALSAAVTYDGASRLTVTNTFTPASAVVEVGKQLNGRRWEQNDRFDFVLEAVTAGAPLPEQTKATATMLQQKAVFGEIIFYKAGVYRYTITEVQGNQPGIIYDTVKHQVVVNVTKGTNNKLSAAVLYDGGANLTVVNLYREAKAEIRVTKQLTGRAWKSDDSFTFCLAAITTNAPMPARTKATATRANQTVGFGTLTFYGPGTYVYKVWEEAGNAAGITYDSNEHRVIIAVTRDEKTGDLRTAVSYDNASSLTVTNKYSQSAVPAGGPDTGDRHQPILWAFLAAASLLGIVLALRYLRKLRETE